MEGDLLGERFERLDDGLGVGCGAGRVECDGEASVTDRLFDGECSRDDDGGEENRGDEAPKAGGEEGDEGERERRVRDEDEEPYPREPAAIGNGAVGQDAVGDAFGEPQAERLASRKERPAEEGCE